MPKARTLLNFTLNICWQSSNEIADTKLRKISRISWLHCSFLSGNSDKLSMAVRTRDTLITNSN
jgi:hypothetical protein